MELEKILWKFRKVILGIACLVVLMSGGSETASAEYTHVFHVGANPNDVFDGPRDVYIDFENIMSVDGHYTGKSSVWTRYIVPVIENDVHIKYIFMHSDLRDRTLWYCYYTLENWANTWYYYTAEDWAGKTIDDMVKSEWNGLGYDQPVGIDAHSDDFMFNYETLDFAKHLYAGILYKTLQFKRGMINGSEPLITYTYTNDW